jgi:rod shape-determining protein MreC
MPISFSRGWARAGFAAAVAGVIAILNIPAFNSAAKNGFFWIANPLQKTLWAAAASLNGAARPVFGGGNLAKENDDLKNRVNELLAKTASIDDLKKENDFLRQALNLEMDKEFDLKMANIVGKTPARDILIIDKGADDLVVAGMPVITEQKTLAGKVSKVYAKFSEVLLITDKDFSFDVKIGQVGVDGLSRGQGNCRAAIDLIPKDKDLQSGQEVFTSALGGIFPPGFLVGTVKEVQKNDIEAFQSAQIEPAFDSDRACRVFVAVGKYPLNAESANAAIGAKHD